MKKLHFLTVFLMMTQIGLSQVGINTTTPNAQLEIRSSNQITPSNTDGILIPKIDAFPLTNPTAAQQGMMVYLTTLSAGKPPGFYSWNNPTATWLGLGGSSGWALTGNSGTNPATNFIGTTDANDVVFRRDNVISGKIGMANTSFGRNSMNPLSSGIYNSAYGLNSMSSNTSGNSNSAFGNYALNNNTSGNANTAFGSNVMYTNTTGQQNTAFGSDALEYNTIGNYNSSVGYYALHRNTSGNNNTADGYQALYENVTGSFNTAVGSRALYFNKTGVINTAVGDDALSNNDNGNLNVAVGGSSLLENISGGNNTAVGLWSLRNNTVGDQNTAVGTNSLLDNSGSNNTAVGYDSGINISTGNYNIAIGSNSSVPITNGDHQMSIGNVLYGADMNSTATGKIGIGVPTPTEKLEVDGKTKTTNLQVTNGALAGRVLTSDAVGNATWQAVGAGNSWSTTGNSGLNAATNFIGTTDNVDLVFKRFNLFAGKIGSSNTSFGINSLANTTGTNSVAIGTSALVTNTLGSGNVAVGVTSMLLNTIGSDNNVVGYGALSNNRTANKNIAIGNNALFIQSFTNGGVAFDTNNTAIGYEALYSNNPIATFNGKDNVAVGNYSLRGNTIGYDNTAVGTSSLFTNTSGRSSTAVGNQALFSNTTGNFNVATGYSSLYTNTTGAFNTANGSAALYSNTSGTENTAIGSASLYTNSSGIQNVANGFDALYYNSTGSRNNAIGYRALYNTTVGADNVANGHEALRNNRSASYNIAIGTNALFSNNFANGGVAYDAFNTAIGFGALYNTTSTATTNGISNIGIGMYALSNNGTGNSNIALGNSALGAAWTGGGSMTGNRNVAVGGAAIKSNTTGSGNIAMGSLSLNYNNIGNDNISIGTDALFHSAGLSNGTVVGTRAMQNYAIFSVAGINDNVAIGYESLRGTNTAATYTQNTAVGYQSMTAITLGNNNTATGYQSLFSNTSGTANTAFGNGALRTNISGSNNIAIGYQAGYNETGSNKLYIENSNSITPLIYGEFDTDLIRINGRTEGIYTQLTANGDGQSSIYGYRTRDSQNDGVNYSRAGTNKAINGYNFWGDVYTFGVAGHSYNDYNRTGGVLGADVNGIYWASLGYRNSGLVNYGVYATAALATGAGRLSQRQNAFSIGGGFYGDMIGSWSRGTIIGHVSSGTLFASYNSGDEYTLGKQIELIDTGATKTAAYTVTSTESIVYKKGKITLQNGTAYVSFDANYINLLGDVPVVTTTPMGQCNGLYIESVDKNGFTIKELNNGTSSVSVSWIAVGDRIDAHSTAISPSVLDRNFDANMNDVMFNENNTSQEAKAIWTEGNAIQFGQLPEKLIEKPTKEVEFK